MFLLTLGVDETALKENPCLFLLDLQMQIYIFLQESHSCETDVKWWRSQWGDQIFCCHASHHSAGVTILFNKFKGDVLESVSSTEGVRVEGMDEARTQMQEVKGIY